MVWDGWGIIGTVKKIPHINFVGPADAEKRALTADEMVSYEAISKEIKDISHLIYALNRLLPVDIKIKSLKKVDDHFHARFSAKKKEYLYKIYTGKDIPFYARTHWICKSLDIKLLKEASKVFVGKHNFQNLTSKEKDPKDFIRTIYSIKVKQNKDSSKHFDLFFF